MGCTSSKPSRSHQDHHSRPSHPQPITKTHARPTHHSTHGTIYQSPHHARPTHHSTHGTIYQSPHHAPPSHSEKARMNARPLPPLPSKAELRSKGQLDAHGKLIANPQASWNGKKTMPRPYPGQAIKRKPVPAPAKQHINQHKVAEARPAQVPREIKRVAANHGQQRVAFIDGKFVGPAHAQNGSAGFKGYMVQKYDGKWVPAKDVMRGKGGNEVVHAGGWF